MRMNKGGIVVHFYGEALKVITAGQRNRVSRRLAYHQKGARIERDRGQQLTIFKLLKCQSGRGKTPALPSFLGNGKWFVLLQRPVDSGEHFDRLGVEVVCGRRREQINRTDQFG